MPNEFAVYVINLDRSPERLSEVTKSANLNGIQFERVPAVDGNESLFETDQIDRANFRRANGRPVADGEVGCYLSHVKALKTFLASSEEVALICEDDILFGNETLVAMSALLHHADWHVVKLINFRYRGFIRHRRLRNDRYIGRCIHGPSGSSAAYAVTKDGARRLLATLLPMIVPFDVALERGWNGNLQFYMTDRPAVQFQPENMSTIAQGGYGRTKLPPHKRIEALLFRSSEYGRRVAFSLKRSS